MGGMLAAAKDPHASDPVQERFPVVKLFEHTLEREKNKKCDVPEDDQDIPWYLRWGLLIRYTCASRSANRSSASARACEARVRRGNVKILCTYLLYVCMLAATFRRRMAIVHCKRGDRSFSQLAWRVEI